MAVWWGPMLWNWRVNVVKGQVVAPSAEITSGICMNIWLGVMAKRPIGATVQRCNLCDHGSSHKPNLFVHIKRMHRDAPGKVEDHCSDLELG